MRVSLLFPDNDSRLQESGSRTVRCRGRKDWAWETKKTSTWNQEALPKFMKKYSILYTICRGGWWAKVSKDLSQTMMTKNTEYLQYSCLRTENHSLSAEKAGFSGTKTPLRFRLQPQTGSCHACPREEHRISFPFVLSLGPLRKTWEGLIPHTVIHS